ncbi:hypothetical protein DFA_06144 [Cavenderia fasciculata]|uniref:Kinase n=1 Tax=Cavenderia fasciculata TaxID=261658 RepID=F4PK82_CACFS|nr:uncharacterized protein DFA_06144 [Cavenderia fasciculata]EGG24006.1 hypothetical protein DFA_06144 [Cavenderia fasciculata]|eukprot:XP_004361857.1 hypothetical protein DFA_06144 [Cavenderia fasciculata]
MMFNNDNNNTINITSESPTSIIIELVHHHQHHQKYYQSNKMIPSSPIIQQPQQQQETLTSINNDLLNSKVSLLNIQDNYDNDELSSHHDVMPCRSIPSSSMASSTNGCGFKYPEEEVIRGQKEQEEEEEDILIEEEDADSSSSTTSSCSSLPYTSVVLQSNNNNNNNNNPLSASSSSISNNNNNKSTPPMNILAPNSLYQVCNTKRNLISTSPILFSIYSNHSTPQTPLLLSQQLTLPPTVTITSPSNNNNNNINTPTPTSTIPNKLVHSTSSDDESVGFINHQNQLDSSFTDEDDLLDNTSSNGGDSDQDDDGGDEVSGLLVVPTTPSSSSNLSLSSSEIRKRSISITFPDLTLLSHQVAGQCPLLKLPDGKVLKPLVPTEYQFYKSLEHHSEFIDFTPKFFGIDHFGLDHEYLEQSCNKQSTIFNYAHWRNKIIKLPKENQNLYIKIEDLTFSCKYPCILDLKMGVRQHGREAPAEKVKKMVEKCKATTSSSLGFRVCGLKVYNLPNGEYSTYDKYYGRSLTDQDIPLVLCRYLDNGLRSRLELLPLIAKRLGQIISLFEQQQCYKFYGGSLLFIYDGQSTNAADAKLNIRMVDFAHAHPTSTSNINHKNNNNNNSNSNNKNQPPPIDDEDSVLDEGYLFGLRNLLKLINTLIQVSNNANNLNTI